MNTQELVKALEARIAEVQGGPSGANGTDNAAFLRGIVRGLEIAITTAQHDPSRDPRAECERFLDEMRWRESQRRQVTDSYGNHVGWR